MIPESQTSKTVGSVIQHGPSGRTESAPPLNTQTIAFRVLPTHWSSPSLLLAAGTSPLSTNLPAFSRVRQCTASGTKLKRNKKFSNQDDTFLNN